LQQPATGRGFPARAIPTFGALALLVGLAACGTRGDNTVGLGFVEEVAEDKAVRLVEFAPPDSADTFQLPVQPETVGSSGTLLVSARAPYTGRALARFDSTTFTGIGTPVDSAFVTLFLRGHFGDGPFSMTVHRATADWPERRIAPDSFPAYGAAFDTVEIPFRDVEVDTVTFRMDAVTQFWVDRPDSNFGLVLAPLDGQTDEVEFVSRSGLEVPRLVIHTADTEISPAPEKDTFVLSGGPLPVVPQRLLVARGLGGRTLLRFDYPPLGDRSTVNRAQLVLRLDDASSALTGVSTGVQRVTGAWQRDSTEVDPIVYGSVVVEAGADSLVFDVTSIVRILQTEPKRGFLLRSLDERPDTDYFRVYGPDAPDPALAPRLRIWYTPGDLPEGGS
jgi:hypothetical protein